jgi:hypothetical protein
VANASERHSEDRGFESHPTDQCPRIYKIWAMPFLWESRHIVIIAKKNMKIQMEDEWLVFKSVDLPR